ncbi:ead/Ea22-like family protein [Enterobacter hormaechei]|nr:ead/Ea22-like family protein [Enterobacter hormaechei]MCM7285587.1 ead/Ea22-like family protein [Enterobacter hormaechei]
MSNIDKQALRNLAVAAKLTPSWYAVGEFGDVVDPAKPEWKPVHEFCKTFTAARVLALLDELEAAHELVELQRFKLERQAEDLHQAKSLESIHREKRFEVEREYSDYKHRAESNSMRLAKEVCLLEDALKAAGIRIEGED